MRSKMRQFGSLFLANSPKQSIDIIRPRLSTKISWRFLSISGDKNKVSSGNTRPGSGSDGQKVKTIHLRLAREDDYQKVLELSEHSEGIYGGNDYIPVVFHDWLKTRNKLMFLAELHGKAVGFDVANIVSEGKTFFTQSLRVHPQYPWLRFEITSNVVNSVRQMYPRISKKHNLVLSTRETFEIALKLGDKITGKLNFHKFDIKKTKGLLQLVSSRCEKVEQAVQHLYQYDANTAASIISSSNVLQSIAPQQMMFRVRQPFEAIPSNIEYLFKKGDQMFADISAQELQQGKILMSFSHGCLSPRVRCMFWCCTLYANDIESFRAHLLRQMEAATAKIPHDFVFFLDVCSNISSFDERRVLEQELQRLNQDHVITSDTTYLFEHSFALD